ncbi:TPA: hypothetical protein I1462_002600 [Staphylococcus pseudintermedius]|uniref:hypothetical protein n=1 Tax=Staphylococcus pseudintermedius TaxID=283734 RepID=UPI0008097DC2|nr:hypothetical protein [Staphylococcus pseudintermedius]ANS88443.1 hypothetical protein A6M57_0620 [Staphylococcus pseudintermedius]EGQ0291638.1 hypothetical protein [Staphylococcus pseudintermedius]EGQ0301141.1 hypothetical protein [Staphylococcus pseudintermedius]EGQ0319743.1 hypothetical protein [Staphylococcus pseudintermedius]EGQ0327251.1 hypothetical protein [Staphylococcus pseudintermedius]
MENKNTNNINEEIEKELLEYQAQKHDHPEPSSFSWPKALAFIIVLMMFFIPIFKHIFM